VILAYPLAVVLGLVPKPSRPSAGILAATP
jgi:hypothetical protein